jgi:hypothetical protein
MPCCCYHFCWLPCSLGSRNPWDFFCHIQSLCLDVVQSKVIDQYSMKSVSTYSHEKCFFTVLLSTSPLLVFFPNCSRNDADEGFFHCDAFGICLMVHHCQWTGIHHMWQQGSKLAVLVLDGFSLSDCQWPLQCRCALSVHTSLIRGRNHIILEERIQSSPCYAGSLKVSF